MGKKWCLAVIFFFLILVSLHIFWVYWLFGFSLLWAAHSYPFLPMFSFVSIIFFLTNQQAFLNMRSITICPLIYRCFLPASVLSLMSFVKSLSLTCSLRSLGHRVHGFVGFFFLIKHFLIHFWVHWVFVAVCRLSLVVVSMGFSLWCFSWCGARPLGAQASIIAVHRLSSCGVQL